MKTALLVIVTLGLVLFGTGARNARAEESAPARVTSTEDSLRLIGSNDHAAVARAIAEFSANGGNAALPVLSALEDGRLLRDAEGQLFVRAKDGTSLSTVPELLPAPPNPSATALSLNNASRRALSEALSRLRLTASDVEVRRAAALQLSEYPDAQGADLIRTLLATEKDATTKRHMALALAKVDLESDDKQRRLAAARAILDSDDISLEDQLRGLVQKDARGVSREKDPEVRAELVRALHSVERRLFWINTISNLIYGLSLGSVLVLAALGLAITFGLMRVINMAHGEMLMLGAYSTFYVRELLLQSGPALAEWYLLFALPVAFGATFLMGVLLERLVIRHLYGRPLETLLATWGLSLILIQLVRMVFGAQNVTVANPEWLSGGFELMPALVVPYSRMAVLLFTASVVFFVAFVLRATPVGLKVRAVTQNREIASSLGIATHKVDMWTFGLGSGLAGLGGVALSQLGNVGPELGQQHIIDSFMVVVLGGVGSVLGTISAGFGLGIASKLLEPSVGAVLGKILLLALLILFIQWRPQGLFALKGRAQES